MSVIKAKRQPGKFEVLVKVRDMCAYTITICKNEKNFPKRDKMHQRMIDGKCSIEDARESLNSWKANAQRGNTRGIINQMDRYFNKTFGRDSDGNHC